MDSSQPTGVYIIIALAILIFAILVIVFLFIPIISNERFLKSIRNPKTMHQTISQFERRVDDSLKKKKFRKYMNDADMLCRYYYETLQNPDLDPLTKMDYIKRLLARSREAVDVLPAVIRPDLYKDFVMRTHIGLEFLDFQKTDSSMLLQARQTMLDGLKRLDTVEARQAHKDVLGWLAKADIELSLVLDDEKYLEEAITFLREKLASLNRIKELYLFVDVSIRMAAAYSGLSAKKDKERNLLEMLKLSREVMNISNLKSNRPELYALGVSCAAEAHENLAEVKDREENLKIALQLSRENLELLETSLKDMKQLGFPSVTSDINRIEEKLKIHPS